MLLHCEPHVSEIFIVNYLNPSSVSLIEVVLEGPDVLLFTLWVLNGNSDASVDGQRSFQTQVPPMFGAACY